MILFYWVFHRLNQKEFDFTRKELKRDRKVMAKALLALGVKKGDIITVATGRSRYDNILIFLGGNSMLQMIFLKLFLKLITLSFQKGQKYIAFVDTLE